jgi:hypothetical protein
VMVTPVPTGPISGVILTPKQLPPVQVAPAAAGDSNSTRAATIMMMRYLSFILLL